MSHRWCIAHVTCAQELRRTAAAISLERLRKPLEEQPMFALSQTIVAMESLLQATVRL